jgi:hypothetical protein
MSRLHKVLSVFCRNVGPGGTTVDFYPEKDGLKAIWTNENCPYSAHDNETYEAEDGHNVSSVSWEAVENALYFAIKKGLYEPKKLRRIENK